MSFTDKLKELKQSQQDRVNDTVEYHVEEWGTTLEIRRLTHSDIMRAQSWAKKHFRNRHAVASGCAIVCLAVKGDELPMTKENVEFLLNEPIETLTGIIKVVHEASGVGGEDDSIS